MTKQKKKAAYTVTSVSVPADMKKRMNEAASQFDTNWSRIACEAFEAELKRLAVHHNGNGNCEIPEALRPTVSRYCCSYWTE